VPSEPRQAPSPISFTEAARGLEPRTPCGTAFHLQITAFSKTSRFAGRSRSRRGDSNPGPLHYESALGTRFPLILGLCRSLRWSQMGSICGVRGKIWDKIRALLAADSGPRKSAISGFRGSRRFRPLHCGEARREPLCSQPLHPCEACQEFSRLCPEVCPDLVKCGSLEPAFYGAGAALSPVPVIYVGASRSCVGSSSNRRR
jgi:hypothetical protein